MHAYAKKNNIFFQTISNPAMLSPDLMETREVIITNKCLWQPYDLMAKRNIAVRKAPLLFSGDFIFHPISLRDVIYLISYAT